MLYFGSSEDNLISRLRRINFDELFYNFRVPLLFLLIGLILLGAGVTYVKKNFMTEPKIEILDEEEKTAGILIVEVAGAIEKPGIYQFSLGDRVEDALVSAGGLSVAADRAWVEKYLNRASKLTDGQKIYIPKVGELIDQNQQTLGMSARKSGGNQNVSSDLLLSGERLVSINSASQKVLEGLPGIGPVYAQNIIEHRPYSNIEELLSKGVLKKNVYEKIKNLIMIY